MVKTEREKWTEEMEKIMQKNEELRASLHSLEESQPTKSQQILLNQNQNQTELSMPNRSMHSNRIRDEINNPRMLNLVNVLADLNLIRESMVNVLE